MKNLIANWNARPEFSFKSRDIEYNFERHEYCIIIDSGEPHNYIRTLYFLELQDSEQTRNDRKYVDGMISTTPTQPPRIILCRSTWAENTTVIFS